MLPARANQGRFDDATMPVFCPTGQANDVREGRYLMEAVVSQLCGLTKGHEQ